MVIIELKNSDKAKFGTRIVSVENDCLKVFVKYTDKATGEKRDDVVESYPLVNVLSFREVPDHE